MIEILLYITKGIINGLLYVLATLAFGCALSLFIGGFVYCCPLNFIVAGLVFSTGLLAVKGARLWK